MAAPTVNYAKIGYQNPHAEQGLTLSVAILPNTPEAEIKHNIRVNSACYEDWLQAQDAHTRPAIMLGGGDSINDHINDIKQLQKEGADVFAMNGASNWAREHGIDVDYQVILDAKEETSSLVDNGAKVRLLASQCNPKTLEKAEDFRLWHLEIGEIESLFPEQRVKQGGYVLVGGESTVGTCALCVAYTQGFRDLHIFGYDSSYRQGKSHGYSQPINKTMPTMEMTWAGKTFQVSIAMKAQAEKFQVYAQALKNVGCNINVYGEGLLQTIYNTPVKNLSEREIYQLMWQYDGYRKVSPGEYVASFYLERFAPTGKIIDFGCGTGRAGLKFREAGLEVLLIDFTDNCRDDEALTLPFIQWDITNPIPVEEKYGFCTDVMEHIPTEDVETVIHNLMISCESVFFQISTVDDVMGDTIGKRLHLTVRPHSWWKAIFKSYSIEWESDQDIVSLFYIRR